MRETGQSRVAGLLGVGFDTHDRQIRITQGDEYNVLMGSGETHAELQKICAKIDEHIKKEGRKMSDYSPDEFMKMVQELY